MAKCKSCGAEIKWIQMTSGEYMPVDRAVVQYIPDENGRVRIVTEDGCIVAGTIDDGAIDGTPCFGYISHFATCPAASEYRKSSYASAPVQDSDCDDVSWEAEAFRVAVTCSILAAREHDIDWKEVRSIMKERLIALFHREETLAAQRAAYAQTGGKKNKAEALA